jgi:competence protein ComEA
MNSWLKILFGLVCGVLAAGLILLVGSPARGEPVTLSEPPTPKPLVVEIAGAVTNPGVYSLPAGSRVQEAIEAAGGMLAEADARTVNQAAFLKDGEKLNIPFRPPDTPTPEPGMPTPPPDRSNPFNLPGLVNINTANLDELESLPEIGPKIAQTIIDYRNTYGPFATIEDIMDVPGIGEKTFEAIKDLITVGP